MHLQLDKCTLQLAKGEDKREEYRESVRLGR